MIGLYVAYIAPDYLGWRGRRSSNAARGPWQLGRFGAAINIVAILWVVFITAILAIPDNLRAGKTIAAVTLALAV